MNTNCFTRPDKPLTCKRPDFDVPIPIVDMNAPKLLTVDASTECHVTPSNVAARMASYLRYEHVNLGHERSMSIIEPHGGTGQLVQACLDVGALGSNMLTIEQHHKLVEVLENKFSPFVKIHQGNCFDDYFNFCLGEYDRVIANPPFKQVLKHVERIYQFLKVGGIAVCLVPTAYKKIEHEVLDILPNDTFLNCKVNTKIIRIIK